MKKWCFSFLQRTFTHAKVILHSLVCLVRFCLLQYLSFSGALLFHRCLNFVCKFNIETEKNVFLIWREENSVSQMTGVHQYLVPGNPGAPQISVCSQNSKVAVAPLLQNSKFKSDRDHNVLFVISLGCCYSFQKDLMNLENFI